MTDLVTPLKNAMVARLSGSVGAPVFDHVPDGQLPPVVIVDQIATDDEGDKDGAIWRATVSLQVVAQGRSRNAFRAIMADVRTRLHQWQPAAADGVLFGTCLVLSSGEQTLGDGLTHLGDVQTQLFVQPA